LKTDQEWGNKLRRRPIKRELLKEKENIEPDITLIKGDLKDQPWQQQLSALGSIMKGPANVQSRPIIQRRQIIYVIDIKKTINSQKLVIDLLYRDQGRTGEWSRPEEFIIPVYRLNSITDPLDRQLITLLYSLREQPSQGYGYSSFYYSPSTNIPSNYSISMDAVAFTIIPVLCKSNRCFVRQSREAELQPLTFDNGPAWEFWLEIKERPTDYIVEGSLKRGEVRRGLSEASILLSFGLVFFNGQAARLDDGQSFAWISILRDVGTILVPKKQIDQFLGEVFQLPIKPRLDLPEKLSVKEAIGTFQPRLIVRRKIDRNPYLLSGSLQFAYGSKIISEGELNKEVFDPEVRTFWLRNQSEERAARELLLQLGFKQKQYGTELELTANQLPRVAHELLQKNWYLEAEGKVYRKHSRINIKVKTKIDWFELRGRLVFGETSVAITSLLEALKRGENFVRLDDGTLGLLPEEWLRRYGLIAGLGKPKNKHIRFSRGQVGFLDSLIASSPEIEFDAAFAESRKQLRRFAGIKPSDPPKSFIGKLREYQKEGLGWLKFLQKFCFGGCLADDMGLGKTIEALALLESRRLLRARRKNNRSRHIGPSMVVIPKSLVFNWMREAERFAPKLDILVHTGQNRSDSVNELNSHDLVITTYGVLQRDISLLKKIKFDYLILDEAQAIKNSDTKTARATRQLIGDNRLALSGTPVENHLGELWSVFEFLNPGMLGSLSIFQKLIGGSENPDESSRAILARALRPFILRRTKDQVARDLPQKTEQTIYCEMESDQRKFYNELRDYYRNSLLDRIEENGLKRSKIFVLEALLRLRQAACHPGLIDKKRSRVSSTKLEMLLPRLKEVMEEGHKALVFSQFTSMLAIVRQHLDYENICYEYLDGRTHNRSAKVDRFQTDPECKLFLISLKAGGQGLNLTAAEYVFLLDPWWNPAVEFQAIDRAHRIGQTRRVFAYRLIVRETVEEKVLDLQKRKRDLINSIITEDNSLIRSLKIEDLELLFS
jgi:SNF2 family DNA or RNA helicase